MLGDKISEEYNKRYSAVMDLFLQRMKNPDGRDDAGYDADGYDVDGFDRYGFNRRGLSKTGLRISDYDAGFDHNGRDPWGRAKEIDAAERAEQMMRNEELSGECVDEDGFDEDGYDEQGYNREGFDRDGLSRTGHYYWEYADGYDLFNRDAWGRHRFSDDHFFNISL